jgi:hypothetical protein
MKPTTNTHSLSQLTTSPFINTSSLDNIHKSNITMPPVQIDPKLQKFGAKYPSMGPSLAHRLLVGAALGVVSGYYIFNEPLREYAAEQQRMRMQGGQGQQSSEATDSKK